MFDPDALGEVANEAVVFAARQLLGRPIGDACVAILEDVCLRVGTNRSWMYEYNGDHTRFRNTYEWARTPKPVPVTELSEAPVTMIAWLHAQVMHGRPVGFHDTAAMPVATRVLQEELLRHGTRSCLAVPMVDGGRVLGCIGFDETARQRRWSRGEVALLYAVGGLVAAARFRPGARDAAAGEAGAWFKPLVYLRRGGGIRGVTLEQIIGARSAHDYTEIWMADGSQVLDSRPLGLWEGLLPASDFQRIHRTAIVNLTQVADLDWSAGGAWLLRLRGATEGWSVSRPYRRSCGAASGLDAPVRRLVEFGWSIGDGVLAFWRRLRQACGDPPGRRVSTRFQMLDRGLPHEVRDRAVRPRAMWRGLWATLVGWIGDRRGRAQCGRWTTRSCATPGST